MDRHFLGPIQEHFGDPGCSLLFPLKRWPEQFQLGEHLIGREPFFIAEAGVNHNGNLERALAMVDAASEAGAHAVKFQSFRPEKLVSHSAGKAAYQVQTTGSTGTQLDMLRSLALSDSDTETLFNHCQHRGILFLSTPFDTESADHLAQLGVPGFKISSTDLDNLPLLHHIAGFGLPMILSTGMATPSEIHQAVKTCDIAGCPALCLLQCVTAYPSPADSANLRVMDWLRSEFQLPVGYSDHTHGLHVALAAVARGACVIEKHFTLDQSLPGPDHSASIEPSEVRDLCRQIQEVFRALGDGVKSVADAEREILPAVRRSLHWAMSLPAGTQIEIDHLVALRPAGGLKPGAALALVGATLTRNVVEGEKILEEDYRHQS